MDLIDIRMPAVAPDYAPVVIAAACESCEFDGDVKAAVVEEERCWSESYVTYEFECPEGHVNRMRVKDGDDS